MKKGVLLVNLGSPKSTATKDVRSYLDEFLMDKRVLDIPYVWRALLVKGIILNTRPKRSAEAYKKIWWDEGSPLIVLSERLKEKVLDKANCPVALAMRYGTPSIKEGLEKLYDQGIREILLIPLYPQYAMATTETVVEKALQVQSRYFKDVTLESLPPFYNDKDYIRILSDSIAEVITKASYDHILFSYHGIPERHIRKTDPSKSHCLIDKHCCNEPSSVHKVCYRHQCFSTTKQIADFLNLKKENYSTSFQSRLGKDPWLQPYTDITIEKLAQQGVKKLAVVTPAFVSDCLETLEEIGMEGKHLFTESGGNHFTLIPCLNDRDDWAALLSKWINQWCANEFITV